MVCGGEIDIRQVLEDVAGLAGNLDVERHLRGDAGGARLYDKWALFFFPFFFCIYPSLNTSQPIAQRDFMGAVVTDVYPSPPPVALVLYCGTLIYCGATTKL